MSKKVAGEIDGHVGRRIRLGRSLLGMTQGHLARLLGVTFQQVQKYEKGSNRISAGRLIQVADILCVPVGFFYNDVTVNPSKPTETLSTRIVEFLCAEEGALLIKSFINIKSPQIRRRLLELIQQLSNTI